MDPEPSTSRDDHPNQWEIKVRGHPPRVKDIRWRKAIRDEVEVKYPQAPFTEPPSGTTFDVEVSFRMTPEDLARPAFDLDNFVKPVLDTIFTSQNVSPEVTGVLFPVNDTWVFRLILQKVRVETPQDQGADITVTSHPPRYPGSAHCSGFSLRVKARIRSIPWLGGANDSIRWPQALDCVTVRRPLHSLRPGPPRL